MRFILKKIASTVFTLLAVSLVLFISFDLISGDVATRLIGTSATPERLAEARAQLGLDQPIAVQYLRWLSDFVTGDWGVSYIYKQPVSELLAAKLPVTLSLALLSFVLMCLIALPMGIFTGKHAGSRLDRVLLVVNQVIMAIPSFLSGILISWLFGMVLHLFSPGGFVSPTQDLAGFLAYLAFPAIAIALPRAAQTAKLLRGSILEEAGKNYTRTAYSRGNDTNGVLFGHVLKNAFLPVITFLGMSLANLLAGSLVVERVFNIPGISNTLLTSIGNRDYPVVLAIVMWIAIVIIVVNLLVDISYRVLDPRIGEED